MTAIMTNVTKDSFSASEIDTSFQLCALDVNHKITI